ncbi:alkaline phosphatase [Patulibacter americanus]|uniref:alkaline phosphatase n=1 Tax=Patulibacter americanus TaxID=588672 RepID=UPI0003B32A4D|nr:alkaline phosphatase [Patulibacter americanus]
MPRRTLLTGLAVTAVAVAGAGTAVAVGTGGERSAAIAGAVDPSVPKNVILMIGDGMGDSEITAARAYQGLDKPLRMDGLPFRGAMTVHSLGRTGSGTTYDPVPDSASAITAMATGRKTQLNRLSQGPADDPKAVGDNAGYVTAMERAKQLGKRTGNVTTVDFNDATPAGQLAHMSYRECFTPQDAAKDCAKETKKAGGPGSIYEQIIDSKTDLMVGSGRDILNRGTIDLPGTEHDGKSLEQYAKDASGYRYLTTKDQFLGVKSLKDGPVFAQFGLWNTDKSSHPREFQGSPGTKADEGLRDDDTCKVNETYPEQEVPRIDASTEKALQLLSEDNDKGFFLQIEGGAIDDEAHAAHACLQIGETLAFDRAVGKALDYQAKHPDTLVIVTADHGQAGQILSAEAPQMPTPPVAGDPASLSEDDKPAGRTRTLRTKDGSRLRLGYATSNRSATGSKRERHVGVQVPIMAVGPQAANIMGTIDNTDLYPLLTFAKQPSELPDTTKTVTVSGPATTVTTPGPAVTTPGAPVPGPTREVPGAPALQVGVAAPRTIRAADLRAGLPVSIVATRGGRATVQVQQHGRTIASGRTTVGTKGAKAVRVKARLKPAARGTALRVRVTVTAGGQTRTATAAVTARR